MNSAKGEALPSGILGWHLTSQRKSDAEKERRLTMCQLGFCQHGTSATWLVQPMKGTNGDKRMKSTERST